MSKAIKPISRALWGIKRRPATPKKSRFPPCKGGWRTQTHQRDQNGHPPPWCHRYQGQRYHRRCPIDSTPYRRLPGAATQGPLSLHRQREPTYTPWGHRVLLPRPPGTRFYWFYTSWTWADRNPENMDHNRTQRLCQFSPRGTVICYRKTLYRKKKR